MRRASQSPAGITLLAWKLSDQGLVRVSQLGFQYVVSHQIAKPHQMALHASEHALGYSIRLEDIVFEDVPKVKRIHMFILIYFIFLKARKNRYEL